MMNDRLGQQRKRVDSHLCLNMSMLTVENLAGEDEARLG